MFKKCLLAIFAMAGILSGLILAGQAASNKKIFQTDKIMVIDGKLDEWESIPEFPVDLLPDGTKVPASADIGVTVKFTYDSANFYTAVKAVDDQFEFPSRAWRYGDGFYLTFVDPEKGNESDRFWTYGFSWEENKKNVVLVNRDGIYFPGPPPEEIQLEISMDKENKTILYEIAIPWNSITPVKPFIDSDWGINVIYVDREKREREIRQLYPDLNYDTEETNKRKGDVFSFVNHLPQEPEFESQLNGSHFYSEQEKTLTIAINSSSEFSGWKAQYVVSSAKKSLTTAEPVSLAKGMNFIRYSLPKEDYPSGVYDVSLGIIDKDGSLRYTGNHTFFIVSRDELDSLAKQIAKIKEGKPYAEDAKFRNSFPALEIRLQWIQDFAQNAQAYADIRDLKEWDEEMTLLFRKVEIGEPALFPPGSLGRLAHRSQIDGTLQPYSLFVPGDYTGQEPVPLYVALHGSGVDERQFAYSVTSRMTMAMGQGEIGPMIILAPKARDLSGWYLGNSGRDVLECIEHVKTLYRIDSKRIVLEGFSMGGYGAWRLSLLYSDMFKGAVIGSGAITPPLPLAGENIIDLMKPGIKVSYLVIHGDNDNAVPVTNARSAVQKLKQLGIEHRYIEVKGGAHGNYDRWNEILSWLRALLWSR